MPLHFLADIIGDGSEENEFRPSVALYSDTIGWRAEQPANPQTGHPLNSWCLVVVLSGDIAPLLSDLSIDPLPDCALDTPTDQIEPVQMMVMRNALTRRGIGADLVDAATTFGAILVAIAARAKAGPVPQVGM